MQPMAKENSLVMTVDPPDSVDRILSSTDCGTKTFTATTTTSQQVTFRRRSSQTMVNVSMDDKMVASAGNPIPCSGYTRRVGITTSSYSKVSVPGVQTPAEATCYSRWQMKSTPTPHLRVAWPHSVLGRRSASLHLFPL